MKFKIEVEIDWIDDEHNIDSEIKQQIINEVISSIKNKVVEECNAKVDKKLENLMDKEIAKLSKSLTKNYLNRTFTKTDNYGDIIEETTILKHLKTSFHEFWNQEVNERGNKKERYDNNCKTRIQWAIDDSIEKEAKVFAEKLTKDTENKIKKIMHDSVKEKIGDKFCSELGFDNVLKLNK